MSADAEQIMDGMMGQDPVGAPTAGGEEPMFGDEPMLGQSQSEEPDV